jgi:hypothetical protein
MALTADVGVPFIETLNGGVVVSFEVGATEVIFKGSAVTSDAGFASTFNAAEQFIGIALEGKTGGTADGDVRVRCQVGGVAVLAVTSVTVADLGEGVFATDDNTYAFATTSANGIGRIIHVPAAGTAWVQLKVTGEATAQAITVAA